MDRIYRMDKILSILSKKSCPSRRSFLSILSKKILSRSYSALGTEAMYSLIHSVVTDFGRSKGKPSARDQHCAANTPKARLTPNTTV